jgi:hypothetical protein
MAIACPSCGTVLPGLSDPIRSGNARPAAAPAPAPAAPAWASPSPGGQRPPTYVPSGPTAPAAGWNATPAAPPAYGNNGWNPPPSAPAPAYQGGSPYGAPAGYPAQAYANGAQPYAPAAQPYPAGQAAWNAQQAPFAAPAAPAPAPWAAAARVNPGIGEDTHTLDGPRPGQGPGPAQPVPGGATMHQPSPFQQAPAAAAPMGSGSLVGRVKLVVEQGKILGEQFLLTEREIIIGRYDAGAGRCPDIDLTAQDPAYVHRQHVRLVFSAQGSDITVYDMGGRNGSYVNNQLIARNGAATLHLGDKLRIGRVVLRLQAAPEIEKEPGKV